MAINKRLEINPGIFGSPEPLQGYSYYINVYKKREEQKKKAKKKEELKKKENK